MKPSRKRRPHPAIQPTPDQIRRYLKALADQHHEDWSHEVKDEAPHWVYLVALHLRLVELEHMEAAVGELL